MSMGIYNDKLTNFKLLNVECSSFSLHTHKGGKKKTILKAIYLTKNVILILVDMSNVRINWLGQC